MGDESIQVTRKVGEQIIIGDNIVLTVLEFRGSKVLLGLEAPEEVSIHRKEVYDILHGSEDERRVLFGNPKAPRPQGIINAKQR